ncbi:hypothetical protein [Dactylosporangium sp. NPDC048998]|uniref:hypothetical protein n=1 Tax=Dactylosporangium sp. NPDC048998 TaxID=3363976 RepID=UPI0037192C76
MDTELLRTVRRTSHLRQLFYVVVLLVALAGQVSGAVEALGIPMIWAIPAVGALELGGIVVLANADVRRRLGERAVASRILSAAIAAFAVAFNWMAHDNKLLAGFFAGMSALGYLVWLMHTENQRRDRLRAKGDLPPTTPAYEVVGHWVRHPWLTLRAKNLAKADSRLGLYTSIAAAKAEKRKEQRTAAIAKVLHRKIRAAVDPTTADIAVAVYDLDEIAVRLADGADYDGLTALIAADLSPARLTQAQIAAAQTPAPTAPEPKAVPDSHPGEQRGTVATTQSGSGVASAAPEAQDNPMTATTSDQNASQPAPTQAAPTPSPAPAAGNHSEPEPEQTDRADWADDHQQPEPNHEVPADAVERRADDDRGDETSDEQVHARHRDNERPDRDEGSDRDGAAPRETAAAVAYWRQRDPTLRSGEIAARIGRSQRTVYRYWTATT